MSTIKLPKMSTGIERTFRQATPPGAEPVYYREYILHYIHYYDTDGTKLSSKLDKTIPGMLYRAAKENERSMEGEYTYTFPDGVTRRLIAVRHI
jgi:hypothetical protein